jgi:transcriptional regulator with XRE-family HTH domain
MAGQDYRDVNSDPNVNWLGPLVREHRKRLGATQAEVAQAMGYKNISSSSDIEKGNGSPQLPTLIKLIKALGPEFVEDLADNFYRLSLEPIIDRRDAKMAEARELQAQVSRPRRPTNTNLESIADAG